MFISFWVKFLLSTLYILKYKIRPSVDIQLSAGSINIDTKVVLDNTNPLIDYHPTCKSSKLFLGALRMVQANQLGLYLLVNIIQIIMMIC